MTAVETYSTGGAGSMKKHIEVAAAVIIQDRTVFCAQRKNHGELACKWEFPGGKIEQGEKAEDALVREIREELYSIVSADTYLITVDHQYRTFSITMHAYICTLIEGSLTLTEHLDARWLSKHELYSVDWAAADIPIAEEVAKLL